MHITVNEEPNRNDEPWRFNIAAARQAFLQAEQDYLALAADADETLGSVIDPIAYAQRHKNIEAAMQRTMDTLSALIEAPAINLDDILIKLDTICEIVDGTEQSPSEQLAVSAREDLKRFLSCCAKAA